MRQVHTIDHRSWLVEFLRDCLTAYRERTAKLFISPPIGETSIKQDLQAIIEMLVPLGSLPSRLEQVETRLETIHRLVFELGNPPPQPKPLEVRFMFVVKDDHEPVNFSLSLGDVTDAEGNTIPDAQVEVEVVSSDENVLTANFDAAARTGSVGFGAPGVASLTAKVSSGGVLLGSGAADFTVTVGDPAAISSVALNFEGLTETPPVV